MRLALIFGLDLCLALLLSTPAAAFNGQRVTEGPLTLVIEKVQPLDAPGKPHPVQVSLANAGTSELAVTVELFGLADEFRAEGPARFELRIPPAGKSKTGFQIVAGPGIHRALYPVHVRARFQQEGQPRVAEAVEIFAADQPRSTASAAGLAEVTTVTQGATLLSTLKNHRVFWSYLDGDRPEVGLPQGWLGTDETSRASCQWDKTARGEMKTALRMHPAYRPNAGLVQIEYHLQLPKIEPLHLSFANAIRDNGPKEPASDGVTFRVLIDGKQVFERHSDSKVWVPGDVDLSPWAGQQVRLRLESHPGPKRSTTCDSSFWGDPVVIAGQPPKLLSEPQKAALAQQVRQALLTGQTKDPQVQLFPLTDGARAAVGLGGCGLADGWLGFAVGQRLVLVEGLHVAVLDQTLGVWPSALACDATQMTRPAAGRLKLVQDLRLATERFPLTTEVWAEGAGLRVRVGCPQRITDLAPGAADQLAPRVYYGHGYCIQDPQRFSASAGGHNLATSHVGFDFANGLSLLMATDTPPDTLRVDPELRQYSLHVHPDAMLTFVPSARGALDCAVKYRPLYDKQAAGGVARKAGRFVFDLWGGTYAGNDDLLRKAFAYGLTDAMVILHSWQRWGYDYRLPDIFPPNPEFGTQEELRALGDECRRQGVLWGLHDNYIDFYPDAEDYSYEHICFTKDGNPQKAWINQGRDAQSYRFSAPTASSPLSSATCV